jgi:transcriptional regulator with XRE-family HTH domain
MAGEQDAVTASTRLGLELRRLRLELGISQRKLTRLLGLSAHSNLGDYERGRRIPPGDIVDACERLLHAPPGYLRELHRLALRERARERLRADARQSSRER